MLFIVSFLLYVLALQPLIEHLCPSPSRQCHELTVGPQARPWAPWTSVSSSIKGHTHFSISTFPLTMEDHGSGEGNSWKGLLQVSVHIRGITRPKVMEALLHQFGREASKCSVIKNGLQQVWCQFSFTSETLLLMVTNSDFLVDGFRKQGWSLVLFRSLRKVSSLG